MKGGSAWKESSRLMRPEEKGQSSLLRLCALTAEGLGSITGQELRDEGGHGRFGAQMRVNCGEMAGNKVGEQSIYLSKWGLLYHTEDFGLFCCSWGTTEVV